MPLRSLCTSVAALLLTFGGCTHTSVRQTFRQSAPSATGPTRVLAVYEPWFGHPQHINVGYSSQDPVTLAKQIEQAKRDVPCPVLLMHGAKDARVTEPQAESIFQNLPGRQKNSSCFPTRGTSRTFARIRHSGQNRSPVPRTSSIGELT